MTGKVTIVIPVYADWPSLKDCLDSIKEFVDLKQNHVMLINDSGPEADELEKKIQTATKGLEGFSYFRNPKNLGFLKTCNRAVLELDKTENDILLLNSDTIVTAGFLEELSDVLHLAPKHAAVSPRTNNATIATVPLSAMPQKGVDPKKSYELFLKLKIKVPRFSEVPTAHGFCMLIKRGVIKEFGLFDEVFGQGYGEEVDFCQRIARKGYKSLLANRAFVYHLEARSFTLATKAKLLEKNNQIIRQRYPSYQQQVRDYVAEALRIEEGIQQPSKFVRLIKKMQKALGLSKVKP